MLLQLLRGWAHRIPSRNHPRFLSFASPSGIILDNTFRSQLLAQHGSCARRRPHQSSITACVEATRSDVVPANLGTPPSRELVSAVPDNDELPQISEEDIEEQFVRGSGPGGQKINKTASCVVLKHKPSGTIVRCQETRSQMKNRQLARKLLQRKLDEIARGEASLAAQELSKARARKARRRRKSVKKHFKSRRDRALMDE